jgi:hypothetical protein
MVRTIRPRLETLEARDCPTVSVKLYPGGILRIAGDESWDQVSIVQDDVNDTLTITSSVLPMPGEVVTQVVDIQEFQSSKIRTITVDLNDGNDIFFFNVAEGTDVLKSKMLKLYTGAGDDSAFLGFANNVVYWQALGEGILPGPDLSSHIKSGLGFTINMGDGNDNLSADIGPIDRGRVTLTARLGTGDDTFWLTQSGCVADDMLLKVDVHGQDGKDSLFAMLYGEIAGRADVCFKGGTGDDLLEVINDGAVTGGLYLKTHGGVGNDTLGVNATPRTESVGRLGVQMAGGAGDDRFQYDVGIAEASVAQLYNCLIRGGTGTDDAKVSQEVTTSSVETITHI